MNASQLAIFGGSPAVTAQHPHEVWPPAAHPDELARISHQRNEDIGIRGNAGPIGELEDLVRETLAPGRRHVVAYNSGTSALLAAYMALGIHEGDEVIAPVLTYHAAASPARSLGATVVLADIESATRGIDPVAARRLVTDRTKAIVVVHQWGHSADLAGLRKLAADFGIALIEDCSHAHGSLYEGRPVGTFGDIGVFSMQSNKAAFAGEGGVLVTDDQELADRAILAGHYRDRSKADVQDEQLHDFWESGFGLKLRMSPFNAIVGIESLRAFPDRVAQRQEALAYFNEGIAAGGLLEPVDAPDPKALGAWYGFKPIPAERTRSHLDRATLVRLLRAEGVEVDAPSGRLLARLPLFRGTGVVWADPYEVPAPKTEAEYQRDFPVGYFVEQQALSLPTFYRWPEDKAVIDQYLVAFEKVEATLETLPDSVHAVTTKTPQALPRDAQASGR